MSRYLLIIFLLLSLTHVLSGQEIASEGIGKETAFADFLFNTRQYDFAAEEYLKLIFSCPENPVLKKKALESFRMANDLESGLNFSKVFFKAEDPGLVIYYPEIVKLKILTKQTILTTDMPLDSISNKQQYYESVLLDGMISKNWGKVNQYAGIIPASGLYHFAINTPRELYKSPFLAGAFSTIIPGSGKIYAKRWKDGITSLLFVGLTGFQSYRGFHKSGSKSAYGWIMGGLSFGFYLGNVYGSVKATQNYNNMLNENYLDQVVNYYINHY